MRVTIICDDPDDERRLEEMLSFLDTRIDALETKLQREADARRAAINRLRREIKKATGGVF